MPRPVRRLNPLLLWMAAASLGAAGLGAVVATRPVQAEAAAHALPAPLLDEDAAPGLRTAIFAGGCFWGVQGVFEHVAGVTQALSGYAGGHVANPGYQAVSGGATGHAEAVKVTYDPSQVSFGTLMQIFFSVALDPTEIDRQGPDSGTQYRSAVFAQTPAQADLARAYLDQLTAIHAFAAPIATQVQQGAAFYPAEAYHQDYLAHHPSAPYIAINDMPKVQGLQALFPQHWRDAPVLAGPAASAS